MENLPNVEETNVVVESGKGLQHTLFEIFESLLPAEVGHRKLGITEYDELAQYFRQMVDVAVADREEQFNAYVYEQLATKESEIRELKAENIDLSNECHELERKVKQEKEQAELAQEKLSELAEEHAEIMSILKANEEELLKLTELQKAKDLHIAKLTEELNAPKPQIVLPGQSRPSQSLQQLMEAAKEKSIKSAREIALTSDVPFRGKVEITPPSLNYGGSEDTVTFLGQDQAEPTKDTVLATALDDTFRLPAEVPPAYTISGLGGDTVDEGVAETFEQKVERRLAAHEARLAVLEERLAPITTEVA